MTPDSWVHVAITGVSLIVAIGINAFLMGRKFEGVTGSINVLQAKINGKFDRQQSEDEHCKQERHQLRENVQKLFGTTEIHGQEIAVLRGEAKTWRKGEAHG